MEVLARLAVPADEGLLAELKAKATRELESLRGGSLLFRSGAGEPSGSGERLTALAEIDEVPVGYLEAVLQELSDKALLCRLVSIYVEPGAREVGAGEALVELASSWAKEKGAAGIDAQVLPGSREAKNFFESCGFTARLLLMHRPGAGG